MKSLRVKLLLVVLSICLGGLGAVIVSNIKIVSDSNRAQVEETNQQVAELVSRGVLAQVQEYRRQIEILFRSWEMNPELQIDPFVFPDFLWVSWVDVTGRPVFEWTREDLLAQESLSLDQLIGPKNKQKLAEEILARFADPGKWLVFNSSVKTLLPTFVLTVTLQTGQLQTRRYVGVAEVLAEKLFSSIRAREGQDLVLIDSHQNILRSTKEGWDPSNLVFDDRDALKVLEKMNDGEQAFKVIEYPRTGEVVSSFFKFKEGGGLTLILQEPMTLLMKNVHMIQGRTLAIMMIVLVVMMNLLFFFSSGIISPISELATVMEKVGKGEFGAKVKVRTKDEIGRLANVFNKMIHDLKERESEIERAKTRLIQSEKMGAFGQMSAGIAHEVKNPLAGILGYAQMSKKKLPADSEILPYIDIIEKEAVRCKEIVENLMRFARQEKPVMSRIDLNKTVKDSIRLVEHQMSISGIKIVQIFAVDGAPIWCAGNSNQLQQVLMNLMLNAQHAMDNKGTLTITTHYEQEKNRVLILISDTGHGMTEEVKNRIFEPFFTTKGVGKGTGLGLSVSIGIIKDHGGSIDVESEVGKGTTFTITIPIGESATQSPSTARASAA